MLAKRFVWNALPYLLLKVLAIVASLGTTALLARILEPDEFGYFSGLLSVVILIALPVTSAVSPLVLRRSTVADRDSPSKDYRSFLGQLVVWILFYILLILVLGLLFDGISDAVTQQKTRLMDVLLLAIPFLAVIELICSLLKAEGRILSAEIIAQAIRPISFLLLIVAIIFVGDRSVELAFSVYVASLLMTVVLGVWLYLAKSQIVWPVIGFDLILFRKTVAQIIPLSLIALVSSYQAHVCIVLLGLFADTESVGYFRIAERFTFVIGLPLSIMNLMYARDIVRWNQSNNLGKLRRYAMYIARFSAFFSGAAALSYIFLGELLITVFFTEHYVSGSYTPMLILSAAVFFSSCFGSVGNIMVLLGEHSSVLRAQAIGLLISVVITMVLSPDYGAVGAAIGFLVGTCLWNTVLFFTLRSRYSVSSFIWVGVSREI